MRFFIFIFIVGFINNLSGQNEVKARVIDQSNKEPLKDIFIFIANSQHFAESNENGEFKLYCPAGKEAVFTHLNYKEKSFPCEELNERQQVALVRKNHTIEDVSVVSKARPRLRKRRIKDFVEGMRGLLPGRGKFVLDNPSDVLFLKQKSLLSVKSNNIIKFTNESLGYQYHLSSLFFERSSHDHLKYKFKVFIKDLEFASPRERARAKKNRRSVYKMSLKRYLKYIIDNDSEFKLNVLGETRERYISKKDQVRFYTARSNLKVNQLKHELYEVIINNNFLIVNHQSAKEIYPNRRDIEYYTLLSSKTGKIVLDKYGNIINANDVEESGFSTDLRVGALLPYDFEPI